MHKRKLITGLATAGVFTAGLGATVLPAHADARTLIVTLASGAKVTVTVDVPPGTPLDQIAIPGVSEPIVDVQDATPAPAPAPAPDPAPTAPASAAAPATSPAPAAEPAGAATATTPAAAPKSTAQKPQKTTGTRRRKPSQAGVSLGGSAAADIEGSAAPEVARATATQPAPDQGAGAPAAPGAPTAQDPGYALAIPGPAPIGVPNFFIDNFRIPPFLLPIYQAAGIQYGVRWEVLAAINEIETDYGRNLNVSSAGALGWMQFMPSTWKQYGVDANADGKKDPYNPVDAIFASARYLKAAGADQDIRKAVFSYNHADWYVDSVLMRARLIGGLPADLVGSLTGLTQGQFPVHATARYAKALKVADAHRRVTRGNAAVPVESSATRRAIDIYARAGSPAVAVQDGRIVRMGVSPRLGRFVQLRDAYGNTYTYGGLKKLAKAHPVPKQRAARDAKPLIDLPRKDPKPTAPATAGRQAAAAKPKVARRVAPRAATSAETLADKQRLFANPRRPNAYRAGGQQQILDADLGTKTSFKSYFTEVYGLKRSEVTIKPLKVGSQVIAGTILGRLGRVDARAPRLRFEIRPAGKGAPRIDPKPILDGWKLLESTAVYRAAGRNPFFGPDARNPSIGQILLLSKASLQKRVLDDGRIDMTAPGRKDVRAGQIDRRVLATLEFLSASGLKPTVSMLRTGHSLLTSSGNVSEHVSGNAVDIARINGIPILGHQGAGSITDIAIRRLLTLQGSMKPHQIISLMTFEGADNTLSLPDHADHIHVGFRPLYGGRASALSSTLKPSQWTKLIGRIGAIENPTVRSTPSKYAIDAPVSGHRASRTTKAK